MAATTDGAARQSLGDLLSNRLTSSARPASPHAASAAANPFQRFYVLGYRPLIPLIPIGAAISPSSYLFTRVDRPGAKDPRGKAPGVLTNTGWVGLKKWTDDVDVTPDDLARWFAQKADVGLRMGGRARLLAVDCDTTSAEHAATCLWTARDFFPGIHAKRTGRAPKFAILLRVTGTERTPFRMVEFAGKDGTTERVEALSDGKQLKVWGLHPATGQPYTWDPDVPAFNDIPQVTPEQIAAFFEKLRTVLPQARPINIEGAGGDRSPASLLGDPDVIEAAVRRLPNTTQHFPRREDYVAMAYAAKAAIADKRRAFECFAEWSDRWEDPDGRTNVFGYAEAVWASFPQATKIGAHWLLEKLETVTGLPIAAHYFGPLPAEPPSLWDQAPADRDQPDATRAFELADLVDFAARASEDIGEPLIDEFLECGSFVVLYGPSGAGKTFAALDIAWHVAMGIRWNGKSVRRRRVVYIAAEGAGGARKRAEALRRRFGLPDDAIRGWFLYRAAPVDLLRANADLGPAIEAITAVPDVGLVVVDTMSRALAGGDENSPVDMGGYVKNLDRLRAETSACVLNVHHTGKDVARGARGHSLLRAATDTEIEIMPGELVVTKQREIETNLRLAFDLDVVQLGHGKDGRMITSCVVRWHTEEPLKRAGQPTDKEALVLAALSEQR